MEVKLIYAIAWGLCEYFHFCHFSISFPTLKDCADRGIVTLAFKQHKVHPAKCPSLSASVDLGWFSHGLWMCWSSVTLLIQFPQALLSEEAVNNLLDPFTKAILLKLAVKTGTKIWDPKMVIFMGNIWENDDNPWGFGHPKFCQPFRKRPASISMRWLQVFLSRKSSEMVGRCQDEDIGRLRPKIGHHKFKWFLNVYRFIIFPIRKAIIGDHQGPFPPLRNALQKVGITTPLGLAYSLTLEETWRDQISPWIILDSNLQIIQFPIRFNFQ